MPDKRRWLVMKLSEWNRITIYGEPLNKLAGGDELPAGFLPVFDDYAKAVEWAGDPALIREIEPVKPSES